MLKRILLAGGTAACLLAFSPVALAAAQGQPQASPSRLGINRAAKRSLLACVRTSDDCRTAVNHAWAELVFPQVKRTDLGAGGHGAPGVLIEEGRITGDYTLAGGPAVPPPNIDGATAVFALERDAPVVRLKSGEAWTVGSAPDVRLITENTGDVPPTGNVEAFVFDRHGLHGGLSLGAFEVRKTGTPPTIS